MAAFYEPREWSLPSGARCSLQQSAAGRCRGRDGRLDGLTSKGAVQQAFSSNAGHATGLPVGDLVNVDRQEAAAVMVGMGQGNSRNGAAGPNGLLGAERKTGAGRSESMRSQLLFRAGRARRQAKLGRTSPARYARKNPGDDERTDICSVGCTQRYRPIQPCNQHSSPRLL